jgi:hypothetical protein
MTGVILMPIVILVMVLLSCCIPDAIDDSDYGDVAADK